VLPWHNLLCVSHSHDTSHFTFLPIYKSPEITTSVT
jgi:hypothetical protein